MKAGLTLQAAVRRWPNATRTQGPRELDVHRLLRNTLAREGSRHYLRMVDGTYAECQANPVGGRFIRQIRITNANRTFTSGWMSTADAMGWAITLDQQPQGPGQDVEATS